MDNAKYRCLTIHTLNYFVVAELHGRLVLFLECTRTAKINEKIIQLFPH